MPKLRIFRAEDPSSVAHRFVWYFSFACPKRGWVRLYVICYCEWWVYFMYLLWPRQVTVLVGIWQLLSLWSCEMNNFTVRRSYSCCCIPSCKASTFNCHRWCRTESDRVWRRDRCAALWQCTWKAVTATRTCTATTVTSTPACCSGTDINSWMSSGCRPNTGRTTLHQLHNPLTRSCGTGWRVSFVTHTFRHSLPKHCLVCQRLLCLRLRTTRWEMKRYFTCCDCGRKTSPWRIVTIKDITVIFLLKWTISFHILGNIYKYLWFSQSRCFLAGDIHWLPVPYRITYKLCLLMHLIHTGQAPSYLTDIVIQTATVSSRSRLRSASSLRYEQPRTRLKLGQRAFFYAAPAAWNTLPTSLQQISDTETFKRHLKTFLFCQAF